MTIPASSKFIQGQPERELGPGDLIVGLQGSENPKQLVLFDSEGLSFKTTGLTVSSSADINAIAVGARTFSLTADTLGLPVGTYFLRAYESRDGNNLVQEAINLSNQSVWIRSKPPTDPASEWLDDDAFVETGGSGGGGGLSPDGARIIIGQQVFDWARAGNTTLIPITKIPESLARLSQVENWAEVNNNTPIPEEKLINAPQGGIFAEWSKDYHIDDSSLTMLEMGMTSSPSVALIDETVDGENTLGISISKGFSEFAFIPIQAILPRVIGWGVGSAPSADEASLFANLPADDATEQDRTTHARAVKTFEDRIKFDHNKRIRAGTDEMGFPIDFCIYATKIMEVRDSSNEVTTPEGLDDIVIKFAGVNYPGFFDNIVVRLLKRVQQDSQTTSIARAYTAIELTSPNADLLNNTGEGVYTFQLDNATLELPIGTYLMRVYKQNIGGEMGWVQEVINDQTGQGYIRSNASGRPVEDFVSFAVSDSENTGPEGSGTGLTPEQTAAIEANTAKFSAETWAREGNTDDVPVSKIPPEIARVSALPDVSGFRNESQVDQAIQDGVADWAEAGNTAIIPTAKLPASTGITEQQARDLIVDWAETGNTDQIPDEKLDERQTVTPGILLNLESGGRRFIDQGEVVFDQAWTNKDNITSYTALATAQPGVTPVAIGTEFSGPPTGDELEYEATGGLRGNLVTFRGNANDGGIANFQWLVASTGEYFRQLTTGAQFQRVGKGVAFEWAERGNTGTIPLDKLPTIGVTHAELDIVYEFEGPGLFFECPRVER